MSDKRRELKRLDLRRETLRTLVDTQLARVAGGYGCHSRAFSGCGTACNWDTCGPY
jgi:hypothetical protein